MICASADLSQAALDSFLPRKQQIACCEAYACPVVPLNWPELLKGRDLIWWIDNQSVCSAMLRGSSSQSDLTQLMSIAHILLASLGTRFWIEWIDSDSNPSDGLSRKGTSDEWTLSQNWRHVTVQMPAWADLKSVPLSMLPLL